MIIHLKTFVKKTVWLHIYLYIYYIYLQITKCCEVMEKRSELKPGSSKKRIIEESSSSREEIEEIDPSHITDELLEKYASEMPSELPMTVSEELFYTDAMVKKEYE